VLSRPRSRRPSVLSRAAPLSRPIGRGLAGSASQRRLSTDGRRGPCREAPPTASSDTSSFSFSQGERTPPRANRATVGEFAFPPRRFESPSSHRDLLSPSNLPVLQHSDVHSSNLIGDQSRSTTSPITISQISSHPHLH